MKKRWMALLLSVSMIAAGISGCAKKPETEAPTEKKTEAQTEAKTEAQTEAKTEAQTEAKTEAAIVDELSSEAEGILEAGSEAVAAVEEAVEAASETVDEAVEAASETVDEAAGAVEEAVEAASEVADDVAAAVEEGIEEASEIADDVVGVVEEAVESVDESIEEAAQTEEVEAESETALDIDFTVEFTSQDGLEGTYADMGVTAGDLAILYTNDIHGAVSDHEIYSGSSTSLGFAGIAALKAEAQNDAAAMALVDNGDAVQGSAVTTQSQGVDVIELIKEVGYDIEVPGNHEFDYGIDTFKEFASGLNFISANFVETATGNTILEPYQIVDYTVNGMNVKVGYVGICTPESISKSTPTFFQDENGNYIYGFCSDTPDTFYNKIQETVDAAKAEGSDIIIAIAHLGDTGIQNGWSSLDVIANTNGIDVVLDGHSHSVIPGTIMANKDGEDVLLTSTGHRLYSIGLLKLTPSEDGKLSVQSGLVNKLTDEEKASEAYTEMLRKVVEIEDKYSYLFVVEATSDFDLYIEDPVTGQRLIRNTETNLGNFLADVYLNYFGTDVAVLNGGSIRANLHAGEITYDQLLHVYPWFTKVSVVEVSGQVILDMLEMGARLYPEECGGFIQPCKTLHYSIDTTVPSSVKVSGEGEFVSVDGEYRVKDVTVNGEPLDLEKTYTLAINCYYSENYGDGMTMFRNVSKFIVPAEGEEAPVDQSVVIEYLNSIGNVIPAEYAEPYGEGRITILTEESLAEEESEAESLLETIEEGASEAVEEAAEAVEEALTEAEKLMNEKASEGEELLEQVEETMTEVVNTIEAAETEKE